MIQTVTQTNHIIINHEFIYKHHSRPLPLPTTFNSQSMINREKKYENTLKKGLWEQYANIQVRVCTSGRISLTASSFGWLGSSCWCEVNCFRNEVCLCIVLTQSQCGRLHEGNINLYRVFCWGLIVCKWGGTFWLAPLLSTSFWYTAFRFFVHLVSKNNERKILWVGRACLNFDLTK